MAPHWPPSTAPSLPCFSSTLPREPLESSQMDISPALGQSYNPEMGYDAAGARAPTTEEHACCAWQRPHYATPSNLFQASNGLDNNSYAPEVLPLVFDPTIFDMPYNDGRYLCNVPGCESTFTRLGDRNRHVKSKHNKIPHFCLVPGCEKSLERGGKGYTRQDKLQEHMQKKHAATGEAAV